MAQEFSAKLQLLLKVHTTSRTQLAADIGIDKSVVGRWVSGVVRPSGHNLARLTEWAAQRVAGFRLLDWDRHFDSFAALLGVEPAVVTGPPPEVVANGLPLVLMPQILAETALRGPAYEGIFRSTRPFAAYPGRFVHDTSLIRIEENGLLKLTMLTAGVRVDGWMLPLHDKLYCVSCELTSGSLAFGIFNGITTDRADVVDGLVLTTIQDIGRTPTASPSLSVRVANLSGDRGADDALFESLAANAFAPEGSVPEDVRNHLMRDYGPTVLAQGGELLLQAPLARSKSRGAPPR